MSKRRMKMDGYMAILQVAFADRTRSKLIIVEPMFNFDFNFSKCWCKVQRTCKQVIMDLVQ